MNFHGITFGCRRRRLYLYIFVNHILKYNIWLQKTQVIPIHICEPHFKVYHMPSLQFEAVISNIDEADLKRGYVGVVLQSNYTEGKLTTVNDIDRLPISLVSNKFLRKVVFIVNKSYIKRIIKLLQEKFPIFIKRLGMK